MNYAAALRTTVLAILTACASAALPACGSQAGDPHADPGTPSSLGTGLRIREVTDPTLPNHPASTSNVRITGASVLWVDTFDETRDGKSRGTIYLQDAGSTDPYSGVSLFRPTFNPSNLKIAPGDVLDLSGQYQENNKIGTTVQFGPGQVLPQLYQPQVSFRFEYTAPAPRPIAAADLADYAHGRPLISMLVTVNDVTLGNDLVDAASGRSTAPITADTSNNGPTVTNELFDLSGWNAQTQALKKGAHIKSITGVVTFFFNLHVAPRSAADIVVE